MNPGPRNLGNLTTSDIASIYRLLMEEVKVRLESAGTVLSDIQEKKIFGHQWLNADYCYLQIRKICELVALSSLVAHNRIDSFQSMSLAKEWNAANLFKKLGKLSKHPTPIPVEFELNADGPGYHKVHNLDGEISPKRLSEIYHGCGDCLHIGSVKQLVSGKRPQPKSDDLFEWHRSLISLLSSHMIALPQHQTVMIVWLKDGDDHQVRCVVGEPSASIDDRWQRFEPVTA